MFLSSFRGVQAWGMLEPAIAACDAAGSTYGALAALKPGARGRLPPAVTDRFLTLLSIRCQRRSGRAKATVLRFVQSYQVYSAQAVALASIELACAITTPWNGSGNAVKPWNAGYKR